MLQYPVLRSQVFSWAEAFWTRSWDCELAACSASKRYSDVSGTPALIVDCVGGGERGKGRGLRRLSLGGVWGWGMEDGCGNGDGDGDGDSDGDGGVIVGGGGGALGRLGGEGERVPRCEPCNRISVSVGRSRSAGEPSDNGGGGWLCGVIEGRLARA